MNVWLVSPDNGKIIEFEAFGYSEASEAIQDFYNNHPALQEMETTMEKQEEMTKEYAQEISEVVHHFVEMNGGLTITNIMEKWEILTDREIEALHICHKSGRTRWMDITFLMTTKGLLNQVLEEDEKLSMWK